MDFLTKIFVPKSVLRNFLLAMLLEGFAVSGLASGQPHDGLPGRGEIRNYEVDLERDFKLGGKRWPVIPRPQAMVSLLVDNMLTRVSSKS